MKKFINDIFTGLDNKTYDPARVYGGAAVLTFIGLAIVSIGLNHQPFVAQDFGIGFGALLTGFGLGVSVKAHTEPK